MIRIVIDEHATLLNLAIVVVAGAFFAAVVFVVGNLTLRRKRSHRLYLGHGIDVPSGDVTRDSFLYGMEMARRKSVRRKGYEVEVHITPDADPHQVIRGRVLDRSLGGLRLSSTEKFKVGTLLAVRTAAAPRSIGQVHVEVKRCRAKQGGWEIGCRYLAPPSAEDLDQFG